MKVFPLLLLCLFLLCCRNQDENKQDATAGNALFTDITENTRLDFIHEPGLDGTYFMPESIGSGVALFDYDGDQDLDLYLVQGNFRDSARRIEDRLFRQDRRGKFTDVTVESGLNDPGYGMGVAVGDIDNDGDPDVYVTNYGGDSLYSNNGNGTFTNVTSSAGITNKQWGTSAAFLDYDRDGFLDLYVVNYVHFDPVITCMDRSGRQDYCGPKGFDGVPDVLYHNNGNGTFTDVSQPSGIAKIPGKGLGVTTMDFNRDGYQDIYVANDGEKNFLWINQKDGTFEDQAVETGVAVNALGQPEASMGVVAGDADGDLDFDLFMTHLRDEKNTFYRNRGNEGFLDDTSSTGLAGPSIPFTGFGTGYFDYDNDGDLDIAVVNGRVTRSTFMVHKDKPEFWDAYAEPNMLFTNDGNGNFVLSNEAAGTFASTVENSRGLAFGDIDKDGDVDLVVSNEGGRARIYRNDSTGKNWLLIRALQFNRDAIGAEITLTVDGKRLIRQVQPAYSYLSSSDSRVHFGLDNATRVEKIEIRWPDGTTQTYENIPANQQFVAAYDESTEAQ